ncbi:MAG: hypothetical protein K0V04_03565 [Deltaproteobacteria bacterium]|nr:hypothetical protein [Deltaproteobacteria bacterium]
MTPLRLLSIALLPVVVGCSRANSSFAVDDGGSGDAGASTDAGASDTNVSVGASGDAGATGSVETSGSAGSDPGDPVCGNGIPEGDEQCDHGVNDGSYEGCTANCQFASYCGDAFVDAPFEECDDADDDLDDGCLPNCLVPVSCLEVLELSGVADDDVYLIDPLGNQRGLVETYCDMTTDGGGYTFYKMEPGSTATAAQAEQDCAELGMQLFIPRTEAHLESALAVANDDGFGPDGDLAYLTIMGIYPEFAGATCANQAVSSANPTCQWRASDDQTYWVSGHDLFNEPNGNDGFTQVDGSMRYDWVEGNLLQWYDDISNAGALSSRFMCDVGDKY